MYLSALWTYLLLSSQLGYKFYKSVSFIICILQWFSARLVTPSLMYWSYLSLVKPLICICRCWLFCRETEMACTWYLSGPRPETWGSDGTHSRVWPHSTGSVCPWWFQEPEVVQRHPYAGLRRMEMAGLESEWWNRKSISKCVCKLLSILWSSQCGNQLEFQVDYHLKDWTKCRDHFVYTPSQWEMMLHCNVFSHWLGAYAKWSLEMANSLHASCTDFQKYFV